MVVNKVTNATSQTISTTNTFGIPTTTGNMLILAVVSNDSSYDLTSVTDSAGNVYTVEATAFFTSFGITYFAYSFSVGAGVTFVTLHSTGGTGGITLTAYDVGTNTGGYLQAAGGGGGTVGPNPSASFPFTTAGLTIAVVGDTASITAVSSPFTLEAMNNSSLSSIHAANAYNLSGNYTASFTAASGSWFAGIGNFIEVPAGQGQVGVFLVGF